MPDVISIASFGPPRPRRTSMSTCLRAVRAECSVKRDLSRCLRSFGFELQGPCSAFTSWGAHIRDPKTFPLAAHNQELVLRHMTFAFQQLFQISFERGLCFNHCIERFLYCGRQIICIDVLPLQFFLCHCLAPAWLKERNAFTSFPDGRPRPVAPWGWTVVLPS